MNNTNDEDSVKGRSHLYMVIVSVIVSVIVPVIVPVIVLVIVPNPSAITL